MRIQIFNEDFLIKGNHATISSNFKYILSYKGLMEAGAVWSTSFRLIRKKYNAD